MLTKALSAFCDANPGLRVIPVAPRAQAYNKAELTIQKLAGHAFMNAVRARLGGTAWSFLRRGARFAHNHRKAQGPDDPNLRTGTRSFLLTGTTLDASTVLGYCGQLGWVATADGKASAQRDLARPVLYLHPSEESSSQLVLDLRALKLYSARAVTLCMDPHMVSALVAGTALHRPRGHFLEPSPADYATRLRALLAPSPDPWLTTLTHDPVGGLPMQAIALVPCLGPDGSLEMVPASSDLPAGTWVPPSPAPS